MDKPIIAITMGDPSGIGPELVVKILANGAAQAHGRPVVIGDPDVMEKARRLLGAELRFREVGNLAEAAFAPRTVDLLCPQEARGVQVEPGQVSAEAGKAGMSCLLRAFDLAMAGQVKGVVSSPLNKEAFHLAGYHYRDELQCLAAYTKSQDTFTMGVANGIWTVAVTDHIRFRDIADLVTQARVLSYILRMRDVLKRTGVAEPRVAVAALNPHGGEGGILGREELDEIAPAIKAARAQGVNAQGPIAADAVFWKALAGSYDGVVFMYHDQANIARKLQPMDRGATVFIGLPVACATTAHGTAFDIVGQGIANPGSLQAALRYTAQLA